MRRQAMVDASLKGAPVNQLPLPPPPLYLRIVVSAPTVLNVGAA